MSVIKLPESTKRRFVQLLQLLKNWPSPKITSAAISESTGWSSSLIRHDLWLIKFNKGISNGYNIEELTQAVEDAIGINNCDDSQIMQKNVCIAGLGRLGAALLDTSFTDGSIFCIKAGFDSNVNRVEILRSIFPLYPTSEMDFVIKREKIEYAILTVADKDAQNIANRLIKAGIKGIVNMTSVVLKVPVSVKVENLSILNALNLVL